MQTSETNEYISQYFAQLSTISEFVTKFRLISPFQKWLLVGYVDVQLEEAISYWSQFVKVLPLSSKKWFYIFSCSQIYKHSTI